MERHFLKNLNIVGALLVSRCGTILHYSIPNLLKWCDWILLMQDNINEETKQIVDQYKKRYPNRIRLAESGFPPATLQQETGRQGLLHRFKSIQGKVRETVFSYLREVHKTEPIDILIFPDSDEIFSDYLPKLLEEFWAKPKVKAITMKPVDPFCDFYTIPDRSMTGHTRIMRFSPELTAIPYRTACYYRPLTKQDRMGNNRVLIHLCNFKERMDWRVKHWKKIPHGSWPLWKLSKDVRTMTPDEIKIELQRDPDISVEDYLRGGDKRIPVGINNAEKALKESTQLLHSMGIRTFVLFGTCLGLFRGQLIKWDWDVDLGILAEDLNKINRDVIIKNGFTDIKIKKDIPNYKTKDGIESNDLLIRTISFKKHGVRIDIDPIYLSSDKKSRLILKGRKREKFTSCHNVNMFQIGKTISLNNVAYNVPYFTETYLQENYGTDWRIPQYGPTPWRKRSCRKDFWKIELSTQYDFT